MTKLHKITPEELYHLALVVGALQIKYGPTRTVFILEKLAEAIKTGKFPNGGKSRELFVGH